MRLLYGRHYAARQRAIADLIPPGASVLEVCCGPGTLYRRHLARKRVRYLGLDINAGFLRRVRRSGAEAREWDVRSADPLPPADFVIMQASLYHFMDDPRPLIERMLAIAARLTDPGTGPQPDRYDEATLDRVLEPFASLVRERRLLPGGREKVYVLEVS
jgi:ubiquinone/menaquinone biosynthesis C-methylase UbiE